jgi:hypothetical protein
MQRRRLRRSSVLLRLGAAAALAGLPSGQARSGSAGAAGNAAASRAPHAHTATHARGRQRAA